MKPSPAVIAHSLFATAVLSTAFAVASGDEGHDHEHGHDDHAHEHAADPYEITGIDILGMEDADPQQMMEKWMGTMQPSKGHAFLQRFEGEWDVISTMWMDPAAPPMTSSATTSTKLIYGGKFAMSDFNGLFMGQPFEGTAVLGFDNVRKQFTSIWFDSMSTAFTPGKGMLDPTGNILTMIGTMDEPMTGEIGKHYKMLYTFHSEDSYTMEMREILYGDEFTVMKLDYTRAN